MLSDSTRVQLLWALADRELAVNDLAGLVGKPAPSVSQHLAKLRMARLVRTRREGTQVFYRLENDHVRQLVTDAVHNAEHARRRRSRAPPGRPRAAAAARRGDGLMGIGHSHDHTDSVDAALRDSAAGIRAVKISLVVVGITAAAHSVAHGAEHELAHAIPKLSSVIVHVYPAHDGVLSS